MNRRASMGARIVEYFESEAEDVALVVFGIIKETLRRRGFLATRVPQKALPEITADDAPQMSFTGTGLSGTGLSPLKRRTTF